MKKQTEVAYFLILITIGILSRLMPHSWNFTAVGASALIAGLFLQNRLLVVLVPLITLVVSDIFIGFHSTAPFVYLGFLLFSIVGLIFKDRKSVLITTLAATASSFSFFIISNFGVWFMQDMYPKNFSGLLECFVMGVPFYKNQFLGDILVSVGLFLVTGLAFRFFQKTTLAKI